MADKIDFPDTPSIGQIFNHVDSAGVTTKWRFSEFRSWVKYYDYAEEAPDDGKEYARKDSAWSEIVYPVPADAASDNNYYLRRNGAWQQFTETGVAITLPANDGTTYGVKDGSWAAIEGAEVYVKSEVDALLANKSDGSHTHLIADTTDAGAMASVNDAVSDGNQYARQDGAWSQVVHPTIRHTASISIIEPLDTDDGMLMWCYAGITIKQIRCWSENGADVSFRLVHESSPTGTSPTDLLNPATFTSTLNDGSEAPTPIASPDVPAGDWIRILITDSSAGCTQFHLTLTYELT